MLIWYVIFIIIIIIWSFFPKMVILLENRKVNCLHWNGVNTKDIAQHRLANVRTVQRIIKSWKETGSSSAKKGGGRPKVSNDREDRHFNRCQLINRFSTNPESREWKKIGVKLASRTVRRRLLNAHLSSRRTAEKPLLSKKNKGQACFSQEVQGMMDRWTVKQSYILR